MERSLYNLYSSECMEASVEAVAEGFRGGGRRSLAAPRNSSAELRRRPARNGQVCREGTKRNGETQNPKPEALNRLIKP